MRVASAVRSTSERDAPAACSTTSWEFDVIDAAILGRLTETGVRHWLIGAMGLAARGYARYTADIDLLTDEGF